jgi:hypothetical protein
VKRGGGESIRKELRAKRAKRERERGGIVKETTSFPSRFILLIRSIFRVAEDDRGCTVQCIAN